LLALRLIIYLIADIIEKEVLKCRKFLLCITELTILRLANITSEPAELIILKLANITSEPAHYVSESAHTSCWGDLLLVLHHDRLFVVSTVSLTADPFLNICIVAVNLLRTFLLSWSFRLSLFKRKKPWKNLMSLTKWAVSASSWLTESSKTLYASSINSHISEIIYIPFFSCLRSLVALRKSNKNVILRWIVIKVIRKPVVSSFIVSCSCRSSMWTRKYIPSSVIIPPHLLYRVNLIGFRLIRVNCRCMTESRGRISWLYC